LFNFDHSKTFPGVTRDAGKNVCLIGSAVFMFIGYNQTDQQTSKVYI